MKDVQADLYFMINCFLVILLPKGTVYDTYFQWRFQCVLLLYETGY